MRKLMNRTLLSQCVLVALTSFGAQAKVYPKQVGQGE